MTYGISVSNEFGESVLEYKDVMLIQEVGNTVSGNDFGIHGPFLTTRAVRNRIHYNEPRYTHFMTNQWRILTRNDSFNLSVDSTQSRFPHPLVSRTSMYFYQVGTVGLSHHSEHYITAPMTTNATPQYGMFAMCMPGDFTTSLPFIRVDTQKSTSFTETHGLQLINESGDITFDSREPFLSVSEVLFVSKSTLFNIMVTNQILVLPLRTPVPNCYISCPFHTTNIGRPGNTFNTRWHPRIIQANANTLAIGNSDKLNISSPVPADPNAQLALNDLVIIVARNPFA